MATFFLTIVSGLAWMGLTADIGWGAFGFGAIVGLGIRRFAGGRDRQRFGPLRALRLTGLGVRLLLVFLWELAVANIEQLRIVLAPRIELQPGWIRFQSELETPALRALLGAMLSLTPGSLTYEESPGEDGGWSIALHVLDLRDEARLVERLRSRLEAPLRAMETL